MKTQEKTFTFAKEMSTLVNQELEKDRDYHPNLGGVTRGGMANHFPMTILSLQGLGASDQDVTHFINHWPRYRALIKENLGLNDRYEITDKNWSEYLGQADRLLEFQRVFNEQLTKSEESIAVVVEALNKMKDALPMGLFHPLIRISFALMHGDKGMIADALAYMAIRYQDLYQSAELPSNTSETKTVKDIWATMGSKIEDLTISRPLSGGSLRICEQLCSEQSIQELTLKPLNLSGNNLMQQIKAMAEVVLKLYLYQPALTTLHGVTAFQALVDITLQGLQPHNQTIFVELWKRYWLWSSGLFLEKGYPNPLPEIEPEAREDIKNYSWSELAANARQIPEVHLIKMAFTCQWLDQNLQANPLYKLAVVNMIEERQAHPRRRHGLSF